MALKIDDFQTLKPIIDQLKTGPESRVSISKSQRRALANLGDEQFNQFLEIVRNTTMSNIASANRVRETAAAGRVKSLQENIQAITAARSERLTARASNQSLAAGRELRASKDRIRNYLKSQKSAINFLKQEGKPLAGLNNTLEQQAKDARAVMNTNSSELLEIRKLKVNGLNAIQTQMLKEDLMQQYLSPKFLKSMQTYRGKESVRPTKVRVRSNKVRAGKTVEQVPKTGESMTDSAMLEQGDAYIARVNEYKAMQKAKIAAQPKVVPIAEGAMAQEGKFTSKIAETIGQDTVRAASVIHSSKMGYAAVGLAAMAGVFGIASAGRQKKNFEQEMQMRSM